MARSALTLLTLTLALVLALVLAPAAAQRCRREPPDRSTAKTDGGGGFRIKFSGGSDKYTPGTIYTVKLMGWRTQYLSEKFTAFSLVAESSRSGLSSVRDAGSFQVFGFGLARFDPDCPSMVTQTSTVPKTEAEVLWMAPPSGAGCVTFKAVVVRSRYVWYMDDEGLTKELCEEGSSDHRPPRQPQQQEQPQRRAEGTCCACDEAKYELRFDGLWSRESHPRDFPRNEWLTHFSDVLVASHVPEVSMWKEGEPASDGLKQVAEWGYTRKLEQEMKLKGRALRTLTRAKGLWHPNVQGTTTADFRVDKKRHLLSAVTMIGPSPDWILGVSGLDLCLKNCSWMEEKVIDLGLFDAGTDSGITYEAPNAAESERQPVRAITATWPADPRAPFYGEPATPVARITLTRSRVIERSCDHQPDLERRTAASDEHDDLPRDDRPECMVTPWTEWSECSVTCGEGLSMRTREYKLPDKAQMMDCKQQLVEKVLCDAPVTCDGRPREVSDHSGLGELSGVCAMSSWSSWSPCSVTCGQGFRMRRRNYLDRMGRKKCFHDTEEKEKCMAAQECADTEAEEVDSTCPVTDWSFWSPCSVTCGRGQRVRARLLLLAEHDQQRCRHVRLMEKGACEAGRASCALDMMEAKRVCMMPREMGPCRGNFERWYFEPMKSMCVRFVYGGCRGNRNNFETFEDCQESCSVVADGGGGGGGGGGGHPAAANSLSPPAHLQTRPAPDAAAPVAEEAVDCMVTPWLPWEPCDRTCGPRGSGRQRRVRRIKVHPRSGGSPCPRRLERYRRCRGLPPCV